MPEMFLDDMQTPHMAKEPVTELTYLSTKELPGRTITLPVVIPQNSNLFFIKHLSPFARCYPPALESMDNPITQDQFLGFVDGLNDVFVAHPAIMMTFMVGGALMGTQFLPLQIAGGSVQVVALGSSAMASFVRVRSYMEKANRTLFKERGLVAKIVTTKKMMSAIGLQEGKMALCDFDDAVEEDPRERRLRTLDGYICPLNFDVPQPVVPTNGVKKMLAAPKSFNEKMQMKMLLSSRKKILKSMNADSEASGTNDARITELERAIAEYQMELDEATSVDKTNSGSMNGHVDYEGIQAALAALEADLALEKQAQDDRKQKVRSKYAKKIAKIDKKEGKIANRILWLVVVKDEGETGTEETIDLA